MKKQAFYSAFILIAFLFTNQIAAQKNNLTFSDWDKNDNSLISRYEFVETFTNNYVDDWNYKDDGYLDDEDFYRTTYTIWDMDHDGSLTEKEWIYGFDYYFGDYITDEYAAIDIDNDGQISYTEYYDILSPTDYYSEWDLDNDDYLSEYELARLMFNKWDYDNSNFIEINEYNEFDEFFLDI